MTQSRQANEVSLSEINTKHSLDVKNFRLYVFQPPMRFYFLPFQERLNLLEKNIIEANKKFKTEDLPPSAKALFATPEYLFKDLSKEAAERYYSQAEKNIYVQKIIGLSKASDLIIIPGTICWRKESNKANLPLRFFRNSAYIFHQGQREKYKKTHLATSDSEYNAHGILNNNVFVPGTYNSPIKKINGLTIGIEICLDNNFSLIRKHCKKNNRQHTELDIHLVLASKLAKTTLPRCSGPLFIRIDSRPGYSANADRFANEIFTLSPSSINSFNAPRLEAATCYAEHDSLFSYEFTNTTNMTIHTTKLPPTFRLSESQYIAQMKTCVKKICHSLQPKTIEMLMILLTANIRFNHIIEMDFPDYLSALQHAGLLTDRNALVISSAPIYALPYTTALIELKQAGLLTSKVNSMLNVNIEKSLQLKTLIIKLHRHGFLNETTLSFFTTLSTSLLDLNAYAISDAYVIFSALIEFNLFKIDYLFEIFSSPQRFFELISALKSIIKLASNDLYNQKRAELIFHHKNYPHYLDSFTEIMVKLKLSRLSEKLLIPPGLIEFIFEENFFEAESIDKLLHLIYNHFADFTDFVTLFNYIDEYSALTETINKLLPLNFFSRCSFSQFINYFISHITKIDDIIKAMNDLINYLNSFNYKSGLLSLSILGHRADETTHRLIVQESACQKLIKLIFGDLTIHFSDEEKIALRADTLGNLTQQKHAATLTYLNINIATESVSCDRSKTI